MLRFLYNTILWNNYRSWKNN